jgi:hypothetical protein
MFGWFRKYVRKIGIFGVEVEFHPPADPPPTHAAPSSAPAANPPPTVPAVAGPLPKSQVEPTYMPAAATTGPVSHVPVEPAAVSWEAIREAAGKLSCKGPHKPLLLLYALARWRAGEVQLLFRQHMNEFDRLVRACGWSSEPGCLDDPFWLLYKTEQVLWEVTWDGPYNAERPDPAVARADQPNWKPGAKKLCAWNARGGFSPLLQRALKEEASRVEELAQVLLVWVRKFFPTGDLDAIRRHAGL